MGNAAITDIDAAGPLGFLHAVGLGTAIRQYEVLRFVAGVGLAGELGAGITLVAELSSRERRGIATTIVATVGILGAVAGFFITQLVSWRAAFAIGGGLGLALLLLRIGVVESGMWSHIRTHGRRGALWMLFWPPRRLARYLSVVLIAVPVWFAVGTLVKYGDVIGMSMGMPASEKPDPGRAVMWCYVGLAVGDLASGVLSQWLRSRRGAVLVFHLITVLAMVFYFTLAARSVEAFYGACVLLGLGCGYWAVFATAAAEQFGTNLRATAATTAPNLVRWSAAASAGLWVWFERVIAGGQQVPDAPWKAAVAAGVVVMALAGLGLLGLRETYGIDLDYEES